jgi:hypothetical protein
MGSESGSAPEGDVGPAFQPDSSFSRTPRHARTATSPTRQRFPRVARPRPSGEWKSAQAAAPGATGLAARKPGCGSLGASQRRRRRARGRLSWGRNPNRPPRSRGADGASSPDRSGARLPGGQSSSPGCSGLLRLLLPRPEWPRNPGAAAGRQDQSWTISDASGLWHPRWRRGELASSSAAPVRNRGEAPGELWRRAYWKSLFRDRLLGPPASASRLSPGRGVESAPGQSPGTRRGRDRAGSAARDGNPETPS